MECEKGTCRVSMKSRKKKKKGGKVLYAATKRGVFSSSPNLNFSFFVFKILFFLLPKIGSVRCTAFTLVSCRFISRETLIRGTEGVGRYFILLFYMHRANLVPEKSRRESVRTTTVVFQRFTREVRS